MNKLEQAARQALEALEQLQGGCTDSNDGTVEAITIWCPDVIAALREALDYAPHTAHYPLTDKEIQDVWCSAKDESNQHGPFWFARAIEKAHGIE